MNSLTLAKGTTSAGGLLGTSTGVYYGANSNYHEILKNWNNAKGWLLYEGRELVGAGGKSVEQWTKAANRYKSYFSFKIGEEGKRKFEVMSLKASDNDASKMQRWCEKQFKSNGGGIEYGKVRKWCTKHVTMEDKLNSEGMELDLASQTSSSYQTLTTDNSLKHNIEDQNFLKLKPTSPNTDVTDDEKKARARLWCEKKANVDLEDGEENYGIFKQVL